MDRLAINVSGSGNEVKLYLATFFKTFKIILIRRKNKVQISTQFQLNNAVYHCISMVGPILLCKLLRIH